MSEICQEEPDNLGNNSKTLHETSSPGSRRSRKKRPRPNKKKRCLSRTSGDDDSFHSDSFSPNSFWQNYQKAFQWGSNQEVAYWRSRAVALELENKMLRQHIKRLSLHDKVDEHPQFTLPTGVLNTSVDSDQGRQSNLNTHAKKKKRKRRKKQTSPSVKLKPQEVPEEDVNDSQLEFEVTEEMKDFFELSMRHKMEQEKKQIENEKKFEEAATAAGEENAKLIAHPINFGARTDELKLLYGDASPTIHGMETAIQLTFRRHCEKTAARLWPNIPLRL